MSEPNETTHLIPQITRRGFKRMPAVVGAYGGGVKVYESSDANGPHIWLEAAEIDHQEDVTTATANLTLKDAAKLRDQLTFLIENHYQVVPHPPTPEGESEHAKGN